MSKILKLVSMMLNLATTAFVLFKVVTDDRSLIELQTQEDLTILTTDR